jgi:phosphoribosylglycinamide formyltransferase 1
MNLGFLASGRGSNMQAVVDACKSGVLQALPKLVISNNSRSGAIARARREGIPHLHLSHVTHPDPGHLDQAICDALCGHGVDLLVLVGYMKKLGPATLATYSGRTINIHPALLPAFGGRGMYGIRVHEAVLAAGACEAGVTIHLVDAEYDHGAILTQCRVPVRTDDTAESLAHRVLEQEHSLLVETLVGIVSGTVPLPRV